MNVTAMTTAQWYRVLVEQEVTMVAQDDSPMEYILSRAELASPNTDWATSWRRARLKGLGTEASSFLWKLLHRILPTEDRLARILPNSMPSCKICPNPPTADLEHCFFQCVSTREVGSLLLTLLRVVDPAATASSTLRLEFLTDESMEMPIVWIIAHTLLYLWGVRAGGKIVSRFATRASLESKISLLRETRFQNEVPLIIQLVEQSM